jgi:transcriptional regulator with XRE-family HTH domain
MVNRGLSPEAVICAAMKPPHPTSLEAIGRRLRLFRQARGFTQAQLARISGLSSQSINNYEGARRRISLDQAFKLHTVGARIEYLYLGDEAHLPADVLTKIRALEHAEPSDD